MFRALSLTAATLVVALGSVHAQWVEEGYPVKAGWNAIWLSHNASQDTIGNLVPVTVEEVWRWNKVSSNTQFTQSPAVPVQPDTQWLVWKNGFPAQSTMTHFAANAAYLVKVADGTPDFTLQLRGKPAPPRYNWASSGLNFFGFPMETPDNVAQRNFETFLSYSAELSAGPGLFKYVGGSIVGNPVQIVAPLFEPVSRGRAYWIRSNEFTNYYGPLRVTILDSGFAFGDTGSAIGMRVENVTTDSLDFTLTPGVSATPPPGQPALAGPVPLQVRGAFNPVTGQFAYSAFNSATQRTLAAGQHLDVVLAVDRAAMAGNAGDTFQSLVSLTDSLNLCRIDLPVSAVTTDRSGLWVGAAVVNKIDQITAAPGPILPDGQGTVDTTTQADADAPKSFPLRLILHRTSGGAVKLLQQVYIGEDGGGIHIIADAESHLAPAKLASARRLSSSTLPLDQKITGSGADLGLAGTAEFDFTLAHDSPSNPFIHTYHPDHDNKNAQFAPFVLGNGPPPDNLVRSPESTAVKREIDLTFSNDPASLGLSNLGWGSIVLGGSYTEVITGLRAQKITVKGAFVLRRVSDIPTLTE